MSNERIIGPVLPPGLNLDSENDSDCAETLLEDEESFKDEFGPALPPGFKSDLSVRVIGPSFAGIHQIDDEDEDDNAVYGPSKADDIDLNHQYDPSKRLVKKSKEETKREKWMLDPPTSIKKILPTQSVTKFSQKSSSSSKSTALTKEQKLELEMIAEKEGKMNQFLQKYDKNKRNVSLLNQHRDNLKNKKPKTEKSERKEFDRDKDLNVPRMNDKLKKTFIKEASSSFGTRFSSGRFEKFL